MRIAIDVMGGDNAPDAILAGSLNALKLLSAEDRLVLVGDRAVIEKALSEAGLGDDPRIEIEATTEVIGMDEVPVTAVRSKKDSSIVRMSKLGKTRAGSKRCEVLISAGNTGACVASVQMDLRRLRGVHRPGIAVTMPTFHGSIILCDVGANPVPRATHLHQYGHMARIYANRVSDIDNPRVALLSIGGEEGKGTPLVVETHRLMRADPHLNYIGLIEGRDLFNGKAEVVVSEGFTGNVVLKLAEGLAAGLFRTIAREILEEDPAIAQKFDPVVRKIYARHDYHEFGGAPLLGINGICLILHGTSEARTLTAAVRSAIKYNRLDVNQGIIDALADAQTLQESRT